MAIDNHSKNSHPSSITYLPLAYHYSSSLHPHPPPAPSIFFTPYIKSLSSFLRHHLSVRCAMWKDECVQACVCEAHGVSIPPLRDQSRCQMPEAHKKEHHAFQLTFSSSVPTHIRLTHLLPTTPAHCTTVSHTSRGRAALCCS